MSDTLPPNDFLFAVSVVLMRLYQFNCDGPVLGTVARVNSQDVISGLQPEAASVVVNGLEFRAAAIASTVDSHGPFAAAAQFYYVYKYILVCVLP